MAWTLRKGQRVFYRSVRVGKRVERRYYGRGQLVRWIELDIEVGKLERSRRCQEFLDSQAGLAESRSSVEAVVRLARYLTDADLTDAGYHRHDRGNWRKKRMKSVNRVLQSNSNDDQQHVVSKAPTSTDAEASDPASLDELIALVRAGDREAFERFRPLLKRDPSLAGRVCDDVGHQAEELLLGHLAADGPARELLRAQFVAFRESLLAEGDGGATDRVACEAVATAWLAWKVAEYQRASILLTEGEVGRFGKAITERLDRDFSRFLKALKELTTMRKLLRPRVSALDLVNRHGDEKPKPGAFKRKGEASSCSN